MGNFCNKLKISDEINTEKEIKIKNYSSTYDKEFSKLETNYNYLNLITFNDFIYVLNQFNLNNATLDVDYNNIKLSFDYSNILKDEISFDLFQSFVENKILKHPKILVKRTNENLSNLFKDNLLEIYKSLNKKLIQFDKENNNNNNNNNNRIKKYNILAFGVLFCNGKNISKIKNIFEIFKNKTTNNLEKNSNEFNDFIITLCLIPAYCTIYSRNKLNESYNNELGDFDTELLKKILDASELKDSVNLCKIVCEKIFENENVNYEKWENLFVDEENGIGFILSPKGIRNMLEKNNV
jgi:hypothetical protein